MNILDLVGRRQFTVLLGKNGAGKSSLLRTLDANAALNTRYITPERGGELKYEAGVENNITNNPEWLPSSRRRNRFENFRQQSATQFVKLEVIFLRELEASNALRANPGHKFDTIIDELNKFLPAVRLVRADRGFEIENLRGEKVVESSMSSGESEFISQAIELLVFARSDLSEKILLMDEPDVHLHPDLQYRFVQFIEKVATERKLKVVIATHSTAILGGFSRDANLQTVPVLNREQTEFQAFDRDRVSDELLPIFGAHPLSSIFNKSPIVLVEGDDDHRVIEEAVRSSAGRLRLKPCVVGTVAEMGRWEQWLEQFLPAIYDSPTAYSVRDGDSAADAPIADLTLIKRSRLHCYAMENLLVTDECLSAAGFDSASLLQLLNRWQLAFPDHQYAQSVQNLISNFDHRRTIKIKDVRNVIVGVLGINKPWEKHVGQVLANPKSLSGAAVNSLKYYLGEKTSELFTQV